MEEFKGTKGKWEVTENNLSESGRYIAIGTKEDYWIAETKGCHVGTTNEEAEYNAKLIACSPEMLEMLLTINSFIKANKDKNYIIELLNREVSDIELLIQKATV